MDNAEQCDSGRLLWELYQKFDVDFLDKLRGAFGFSIWDNNRNRLIVATDFYGIKPVVYSNRNGALCAASRIRQLLLCGDVSTALNPEAIYHYLFFDAVCSPVSIYREVRKLEPGKALCFEKGNLKEFTYYDIDYHPNTSPDESYWIKEIPRQIEQAVNCYIPLSLPDQTGCFLSGGTDSSSVAGYYTQLSGTRAKTFSIGFDDPKYNELDFAHIAANHFGTEQFDYFVTPRDVLNLIDALPDIYDEPFGNASVVAAYYCAQMARQAGVEVLLGGDGGDEIFGGNERYVTNLVFAKYSTIPKALRQTLLEPLVFVLPSIGPFYKAKRYIRRASLPNPERFFSYNILAETDSRQIFADDFLGQLDTDCFMRLAKSHYDTPPSAHDTDRLLYIDMKFTITDNDLRKVTQMVEAAGVQVRYPLLHRDLVDFTGTIPPSLESQVGQKPLHFQGSHERLSAPSDHPKE